MSKEALLKEFGHTVAPEIFPDTFGIEYDHTSSARAITPQPIAARPGVIGRLSIMVDGAWVPAMSVTRSWRALTDEDAKARLYHSHDYGVEAPLRRINAGPAQQRLHISGHLKEHVRNRLGPEVDIAIDSIRHNRSELKCLLEIKDRTYEYTGRVDNWRQKQSEYLYLTEFSVEFLIKTPDIKVTVGGRP